MAIGTVNWAEETGVIAVVEISSGCAHGHLIAEVFSRVEPACISASSANDDVGGIDVAFTAELRAAGAGVVRDIVIGGVGADGDRIAELGGDVEPT